LTASGDVAAEGRGTRIVVRQVAGVLARRIVCAAAAGDRLERGQRIGMIKFGSRAEVYVPADSGFEVMVELGRRVRAGETVLGRFR
jgi:phosphatidylserine decarboxylase